LSFKNYIWHQNHVLISYILHDCQHRWWSATPLSMVSVMEEENPVHI